MNTGDEGLRLVIRAYVVTMGVTVLISLLTVMFLMGTRSCSSVSRALAVLGGTTFVLFLTSVVVLGVRARKVIQDVARRRGIVVLYGVILLASYFVITCGLMVVLNC